MASSVRAIIESALGQKPNKVSESLKLYEGYVIGIQVRRVGMTPRSAVAYLVGLGMTPEQAAAREYLYRWDLAIQSSTFGVPHEIGL